jgi:hypothetical protein
MKNETFFLWSVIAGLVVRVSLIAALLVMVHPWK